jgi:2-dehydro-3-deoxygluconokinase
LWRPERARAAQETLFRYVDLFIASEDAARAVFNASDDTPEVIAEWLHNRFGIPAVAITMRDSKRTRNASWSALVVADGRTYFAPSFECEVIEPIGAGDAFAAGLIYGRLRGEAWDVAAGSGAELAARKHGTLGDFSQTTSLAAR